jgi:hypothetical protein
LLFGVEGLKKAFQLVVISAVALDEPPPLATGVGLVVVVADADAGSDVGVIVAAADEEELEPLEQAAIEVTSTRPSAGTR